MKEMIALSLGVFDNSRVRPGTKFLVPDGWEATWAKPVAEVKPEPPTIVRKQQTMRDMEEAKPRRGSDMGKPGHE